MAIHEPVTVELWQGRSMEDATSWRRVAMDSARWSKEDGLEGTVSLEIDPKLSCLQVRFRHLGRPLRIAPVPLVDGTKVHVDQTTYAASTEVAVDQPALGDDGVHIVHRHRIARRPVMTPTVPSDLPTGSVFDRFATARRAIVDAAKLEPGWAGPESLPPSREARVGAERVVAWLERVQARKLASIEMESLRQDRETPPAPIPEVTIEPSGVIVVAQHVAGFSMELRFGPGPAMATRIDAKGNVDHLMLVDGTSNDDDVASQLIGGLLGGKRASVGEA